MTSSTPKHSACSPRRAATVNTCALITSDVTAKAADGSSSRTNSSLQDVVGISLHGTTIVATGERFAWTGSGKPFPGGHFTPREIPGGDAAGYVASSIGSTPRHHDGTLAVHAPLAELEAVLRWIDHTPIELGAKYCFVQIRSEDLGRLAMTVARIALTAPVTVIEPAELADTVSQLAIHLNAIETPVRFAPSREIQ